MLGGCATGISIPYYNPGPAKKESFKQCRGFNCHYLVETLFKDSEWKKVEAVFKRNLPKPRMKSATK